MARAFRSRINSGRLPAASMSQALLNARSIAYQSTEASQICSQLPILKIAEIFSSTAVKLGDATVNALLRTNHSEHFEIDRFWRVSNRANDYKNVTSRNK